MSGSTSAPGIRLPSALLPPSPMPAPAPSILSSTSTPPCLQLRIAGNGDVIFSSITAAADACAVFAALSGQLAVLALVCNGQAAAVKLFKAGMTLTALERVFAVQLDADIALAVCENGCLLFTV